MFGMRFPEECARLMLLGISSLFMLEVFILMLTRRLSKPLKMALGVSFYLWSRRCQT